jgi:hypothetical protein
MGCVSSRNEEIVWGKDQTGAYSPVSASSIPERIHVCRINSTVSLSNVESSPNIPKSRSDKNKVYTRSRLYSMNASASTDASLPRGRIKYQRERRYTDV